MNAIIIEDMAAARAALRQDLLDYCPEINVIAEADSVIDALKTLKQHKADLIFLDVELSDGIAFDILDILPSIDFKIIFTTASEAFAIQAFEVAAIDYLLKPIDPNRLQAAVKRAKEAMPHTATQLDILKKGIHEEHTDQLILHTQEKIVSVPFSSIAYCQSEGNYTNFYFTDGSKLLITRTLKEFDKILNKHGFIRTHQSYLINRAEVKEFIKSEGGYLVLNRGIHIPVSVRKRSEVLAALGMA